MWMSNENKSLNALGGKIVISGHIVSRVEQRQPRAAGLLSRPEPDVWLFRVQDSHTDQIMPVRFEGPINAMLDQGDVVHVQGYMFKGVLNARKIEDESGAVLAVAKCFVATAACGDLWAPEVELLRRFRQQVLVHSMPGRWFLAFYWFVGPGLAEIIASHPWLQFISRWLVVKPACWIAQLYLRKN